MIKADLCDEGIELVVDREHGIAAKQIPGATMVLDSGFYYYHLPLTLASCVMMRGVFGEELEVGEALMAWAVEERARANGAESAREEPGPEFSPIQPDPEQERVSALGEYPDRSGEWWYELWKGMPEWIHRDQRPWRVINVYVRDAAGLEELGRRLGHPLTLQSKGTWFPHVSNYKTNEWRWGDEDHDPSIPSASSQHASGMKEYPVKGDKPKQRRQPSSSGKTRERVILA